MAQDLLPPGLADPDPSVAGRLAGADRHATAASIALAAFPDGAPTVYVARSDVFADALASGGLADGPVLLHPSCGPVLPIVVETLDRLDPARVVALGGPSALCDGVVAALAAGRIHERLQGPSRIDTAVAIARQAAPAGASTVYLAAAADRPDAVVGGVLDGPLLLVPSTGPLPAVVTAELERMNPQRVVLLGGPSAIGEEVANEVATLAPTVDRVAGADRIATAAAIATTSFGDGSPVGLDARTAYLARADVYADAVAGGALTDGPILLVPSCGDLPDRVSHELGRLQPPRVVALGGPSAVCDDLLADAAVAATPEPVRVSPRVVVLTDEELASIRATDGEGEIAFDPAPAVLDELEPGRSVLSIPPGMPFAPDGASAVVLDITRSGTGAVVTTRAATPSEVFDSGRLVFEPIPGDEPGPAFQQASTTVSLSQEIDVDVDVDLPSLEPGSVTWEEGGFASATWTAGYEAIVRIRQGGTVQRTVPLFERNLARWRLAGYGPFALYAIPQAAVSLSAGISAQGPAELRFAHEATVLGMWSAQNGHQMGFGVRGTELPAPPAADPQIVAAEVALEASLRLAFTGGFLGWTFEEYFAAGFGVYLAFAGDVILEPGIGGPYLSAGVGITIDVGVFIEASGPGDLTIERSVRFPVGSCCRRRIERGSQGLDLWVTQRSADGVDQIRRLSGGGAERWNTGHTGLYAAPAWSTDGSMWAAGVFASFDHPAGIALGDGGSGAVTGNLLDFGDFGRAAFEPIEGSTRVAFSSLGGTVRVGDARSPTDATVVLQTDLSVAHVAWTNDGRVLAHLVEFDYDSPGDDPRLVTGQVWSVNADGSDLRQLPDDGPIEALAVSPSGSTMAYQRAGGSRVEVRHTDGTPVATHQFHKTWLGDVADDGEIVVAGYEVGASRSRPAILLADPSGTRVLAGLADPDLAAEQPAFSPDGEQVAYLEVSDCCHYPGRGEAIHVVDVAGDNLGVRIPVGPSPLFRIGWVPRPGTR